MASLVRVLVFVACGPLLWPAGVCACTAGKMARALLQPADDLPDSEPHDDDHCPGCPAVHKVVERPTTGGPAPLPADVLPPTAGPGGWSVLGTPVRPAAGPSAHWPSGPPLFLSHCALVL